jgi:uncharacterized protein YyaL (SSP411 family)
MMPNRLAAEKSPYLLQHAGNPVDWYPWGEAAFEKARAEGKPIFLSVGYSTCHWCHVMAHESFENDAIAQALNASFVPVKVDREERPDVDRVYMTFVQVTTGSGGWPMSVWLTPDLEPFYGGTYFPPSARWGRPGFIDVLEEIARLWRDDPGKVRRTAAHLIEQMKRFTVTSAATQPLAAAAGVEALARGVAAFGEAFDRQHGGFGAAPKFPRPSELFFLFREYARRGDESARDMALQTLRAMARGGIRDHLGGGFHRYSVDARWHVPHFEKMLYDQAQLALAYLEAFQISGDAEYAQVAAGILRYTARDLGRPDGGFHSAEDADSVPQPAVPDSTGARSSDRVQAVEPAHPSEGAFYVWTDAEFDRLLGDDAELAKLRFGVRPGGNVANDPQGELEGKNVLYLARSVDEVAAAAGRPAADVAARLEAATRRLFEARARRPRPGLDDKVIVAWNGLMIAAFARASRVLRDVSLAGPGTADAGRRTPDAGLWLEAARDAARFIHANLWDPARGQLRRRYRDGEAAIEAYADDFACLVFGLLELFQADGDPRWLEWAVALQRRQDALFGDESAGGWFSTTGRDPSVLLRLKEDYDGAEPAASSVSLWNLLALARLTGEEEWSGGIERTLTAFAMQLERTPRAMPMMLAAASSFLAPRQEVVIVGPEGTEDSARLHRALAARYLPFAVTIPVTPDRQHDLVRLLPFIGAMAMRDGKATAYVCRDFTCGQPATDAAGMMNEIDTTQ